MPTTITLTDFLLARIAEDEVIARGATDDQAPEWRVAQSFDGPEVVASRPDGRADVVVYAEAGAPTGGAAHHIARHDPARVLAECEAKRRIVEALALDLARDPDAANCDGDGAPWLAHRVARSLAAVYAGHPDYQDDWR